MEEPKKRAVAGLVLMLVGLALVLTAAGFAGKNIYDSRQADIAASGALTEILAQMPETKLARSSVESYVRHAQMLDPSSELPADFQIPDQMEIPLYLLDPAIPMPKMEIGGRLYVGTLNIPVLGLELPVMDDCTISGLKIAPCRWSGSIYKDNMVICAHNYQRHFGMLKNLSQGDAVTFTDSAGNLFRYWVAVVETLNPEEVEAMENSEYDLTLYTCTVGGQTRVTVRCMREAD